MSSAELLEQNSASPSSTGLVPLPLADFPRHSPWPSRLLGIVPWETPDRSTAKVEEEYNRDKYAACLDFIRQNGESTIDAVKDFEFGMPPDEQICCSLGDDLYLGSLKTVRSKYYDFLGDSLQDDLDECRTVVELGSGYGYNLHVLAERLPNDKALRGGEFSENAVDLGSRLFAQRKNIDVQVFDFYQASSYEFLASLEPPIVIFTSHAIEQLPSCRGALEHLQKYSDRIRCVFHFEPAYDAHGDSLLALMRQRYAQANDYNTDLIDELERRSEIRVNPPRIDVMGINPLNPTSVIRWEFRK